jgi:integron integrase
MTDTTENRKSQPSQSRTFWHAYERVVRQHGIPDQQVPWYTRWVRRFGRFMQGKRLQERTPDDVQAFWDYLSSRPDIPPWQRQQAMQAVQLLYQHLLNMEWAHAWQWPAQGTQEALRHSTGHRFGNRSRPDTAKPAFRDDGPPAEVEARHGALVQKLRTALRTRRYSPRTEEAYTLWVNRYLIFHQLQSPTALGPDDVRAYLEYLAEVRKVAVSTQNQALNALVFLYEQVLQTPLGSIGNFTRAKRPKKVPVVLTRAEIDRLFDHLSGTYALMASLLYGSGLRLMECVRLRVKDVDLSGQQLVVRNGKGQKDRVTLLPKRSQPELHQHLQRVKTLHDDDLRRGLGEVVLPDALARHHPPEARQWGWQYVFPSSRLTVDARSTKVYRHHVHQNSLQKAVKNAARQAGFTKAVSCHSLRHSFASHLLMAGYDIRTVQELLGHADVTTTMIYTQMLTTPGETVKSPLDA